VTPGRTAWWAGYFGKCGEVGLDVFSKIRPQTVLSRGIARTEKLNSNFAGCERVSAPQRQRSGGAGIESSDLLSTMMTRRENG
jgi:hypothetical protein